MKLKAYAKINLGLEVVGRKSNYHLLDTVFASVNIIDYIHFKRSSWSGIRLESSDRQIPTDDSNLILRALHLAGIHDYWDVYLEKNIPVGGGMAGGSADAAAVLRALPHLGVNLTEKEIFNIALSLGSDVYYCYRGGLARGTGRGEVLEPIQAAFMPSLIVLPQPEHCSTRDVFNHFRANPLPFKGDMEGVVQALIKGDGQLLSESLGNHLEASIVSLYPSLGEKLKTLRRSWPHIQITGSGSALYMVQNSDDDIIKLRQEYSGEIIPVQLVMPGS